MAYTDERISEGYTRKSHEEMDLRLAEALGVVPEGTELENFTPLWKESSGAATNETETPEEHGETVIPRTLSGVAANGIASVLPQFRG
jgi:hypothetical protein